MRQKPRHHRKGGFTLIEVLLVIAILSILAAIVVIAVNPARQLAQARDAQRQSDVFAILNAVHQYSLDNSGSFPEGITTDDQEICRTGSVSCEGLVDLSVLTDDERYLITVPIDPGCAANPDVCDDNRTDYQIFRTEGGRITVSAYSSELGEISVTR
jgi:prepilin-type N-terminal cleavage/methylation domain-containing protein